MKVEFPDHWGEIVSVEEEKDRLRVGRDGNRMCLEKHHALTLAVMLLNWYKSGKLAPWSG